MQELRYNNYNRLTDIRAADTIGLDLVLEESLIRSGQREGR